MKTLVLFKLPGNKNQYATCSLDSLIEFPRTGHSYLFSNQVYEVIQVIEPISDEGGNALLLKLMNIDSRDTDTIASAVQSMINLDDPTGLKSGLEDEPDKVVFVRLKGNRQKVKLLETELLVLDIQALSAVARSPEVSEA